MWFLEGKCQFLTSFCILWFSNTNLYTVFLDFIENSVPDTKEIHEIVIKVVVLKPRNTSCFAHLYLHSHLFSCMNNITSRTYGGCLEILKIVSDRINDILRWSCGSYLLTAIYCCHLIQKLTHFVWKILNSIKTWIQKYWPSGIVI